MPKEGRKKSVFDQLVACYGIRGQGHPTKRSAYIVSSRGAGSYLWSRRFSRFHDRPSKEICQSFENLTEQARNGKTEKCSRSHFGLGFAFDLISLFSLLAIFNDSSVTIRTKGMKDQLCAGERGCVPCRLERFLRLRKKTTLKILYFCCGNFKVHCLPFSRRPIILL